MCQPQKVRREGTEILEPFGSGNQVTLIIQTAETLTVHEALSLGIAFTLPSSNSGSGCVPAYVCVCVYSMCVCVCVCVSEQPCVLACECGQTVCFVWR